MIVQQNLSTQFVFFPFIKGTFKGTVEGDTLLAVNFVAACRSQTHVGLYGFLFQTWKNITNFAVSVQAEIQIQIVRAHTTLGKTEPLRAFCDKGQVKMLAVIGQKIVKAIQVGKKFVQKLCFLTRGFREILTHRAAAVRRDLHQTCQHAFGTLRRESQGFNIKNAKTHSFKITIQNFR